MKMPQNAFAQALNEYLFPVYQSPDDTHDDRWVRLTSFEPISLSSIQDYISSYYLNID